MLIRWDKRPPAQPAPLFEVNIWWTPRGTPRERPEYVRLLDKPLVPYVHMVTSPKRRSLPCLVENCPICPQRSFRAGYAPALLWMGDTGNNQQSWKPIICLLPDRLVDRIEGLFARGMLISMWRFGTKEENWNAYDILETEVKFQVPLGWDVEAVLRRVWGYEMRQHVLAKEQQEQAWRQDLDDLAAAGSPPAPPAPPAPPRPIAVPPPPRPSSSAQARADMEAAKAVLRRHLEGQKAIQEPPEAEKPAILPFAPQDVPQEPKKRAPRRKKGGAS